uniref:Uncharacterized protein n=1 Tax=Micrurus paraensis TaxID=1970185 RepID=A0A2D4KT67_9SAUR
MKLSSRGHVGQSRCPIHASGNQSERHLVALPLNVAETRFSLPNSVVLNSQLHPNDRANFSNKKHTSEDHLVSCSAVPQCGNSPSKAMLLSPWQLVWPSISQNSPVSM